jgi:hypothetical protein
LSKTLASPLLFKLVSGETVKKIGIILLAVSSLYLSGCTKNEYTYPASDSTQSQPVTAFSTLFLVNRVNTGLGACPSSSGLQLSWGLDTNMNNVLDASEITSTQVLCDGTNGAAGSNGLSAVFATTPASTVSCPAGGTTILMALDTQQTGAYSALDQDQQSVTLCNGQSAAQSAYTAIQPIMPCGDTVAYKEVLLLLGDGQVLASFSDSTSGDMTRLTFLPDGSYQDTDDSACLFTLSTSGSTRSMSWLGSTQMTWAAPTN